jgi:hypothetical protein
MRIEGSDRHIDRETEVSVGDAGEASAMQSVCILEYYGACLDNAYCPIGRSFGIEGINFGIREIALAVQDVIAAMGLADELCLLYTSPSPRD